MTYLPADIILIINEYNADHRDKLLKNFNKMKIKAIFYRMNKLHEIYKKQQGNDFQFVLKHYLNDPEYVISILSLCHCCFRHSIFRPNSFHKMTYLKLNFRGNSPRHKEEMNCFCMCRYYSREIFNAFEHDHM